MLSDVAAARVFSSVQALAPPDGQLQVLVLGLTTEQALLLANASVRLGDATAEATVEAGCRALLAEPEAPDVQTVRELLLEVVCVAESEPESVPHVADGRVVHRDWEVEYRPDPYPVAVDLRYLEPDALLPRIVDAEWRGQHGSCDLRFTLLSVDGNKALYRVDLVHN